MRYEIIPSGLDYVNTNARIIVVGKTPGSNQMATRIDNLSPKEVKKTRAFAGTIRTNLVKMLDYIGINRFLGIESCITLWVIDYEKYADFTSILKNCVKDTKKTKNPFISSIPRNMEKYPEIESEYKEGFAADCSKYINAKLWIALGSDVEQILQALQKAGVISSESIILTIPHPSGANAGRIAAFLGENVNAGTAENKARAYAQVCLQQMDALNKA